MTLLALVSTFLLFHLHFTPDNVLLSGVVALVIVTGFFAMEEKWDMEDKLHRRGKYKNTISIGDKF